MKKLICAKDVQALVKAGEKELILVPGMIMTPSAKDAARDAGLKVVSDLRRYEGQAAGAGSRCGIGKTCPVCGGPMPCPCVPLGAEFIYKALKALENKGMLDAFLSGDALKALGCGNPD